MKQQPQTTLDPAAPPDLLRLDAQVCFPLYAATNLITRAYRPLLKPLGLTYPQYLVLLVLWEQPSITVKDLCARLLLDSGTVSPLLNRLEASGLVKKRADPDDGRRVIVRLTAKGERLQGPARQVPEALLCRLLEHGGGVEAAAQLHGLQQQLRTLIRQWSNPDGEASDDNDDNDLDAAPSIAPSTPPPRTSLADPAAVGFVGKVKRLQHKATPPRSTR